eukprot:1367750-Rhodomonas_salina.1
MEAGQGRPEGREERMRRGKVKREAQGGGRVDDGRGGAEVPVRSGTVTIWDRDHLARDRDSDLVPSDTVTRRTARVSAVLCHLVQLMRSGRLREEDVAKCREKGSAVSGNKAKRVLRKEDFSLIAFIQLRVFSLAKGRVRYVQRAAAWRGEGYIWLEERRTGRESRELPTKTTLALGDCARRS